MDFSMLLERASTHEVSPEPSSPYGCSSDNLSNKSIQGYIDIFCKLCIQLHITDPEEVLIVKFNYVLLLSIHHEVDLFEIPSFDKDFLRALAVEHKVVPNSFSKL
jgi:hypothetical protein